VNACFTSGRATTYPGPASSGGPQLLQWSPLIRKYIAYGNRLSRARRVWRNAIGKDSGLIKTVWIDRLNLTRRSSLCLSLGSSYQRAAALESISAARRMSSFRSVIVCQGHLECAPRPLPNSNPLMVTLEIVYTFVQNAPLLLTQRIQLRIVDHTFADPIEQLQALLDWQSDHAVENVLCDHGDMVTWCVKTDKREKESGICTAAKNSLCSSQRSDHQSRS
jgi:hypothetical protein